MNRVLIANRDKYEAKGMEWLLSTSNPEMNVSTALSVMEVEKALEENMIELLIVELEILEDPTAVSLLRQISINKPCILAVTMEATFEQAKNAIDLGAKDLLLKPVAPDKLLKTVKKIMREQSSLKKSNDLLITENKETVFKYNDFYSITESPSCTFPLIAYKTEDIKKLSVLYSYLLDYSFRAKIDFYIFDELIVGVVKKGGKFISEECNRFMGNWHDEYKIPAFCIIYIGAEKGLSTLYEELKELTNISFYTGFKQVLEFRGPIKWKQIDPFLSPGQQTAWITFLKQTDTKGIRSWLYKEFLECIQPYPDPNLIRIRLTSLLAQIRRYMKTIPFLDQRFEKEYHTLFQKILYSPLIYRIVQELIFFISSLFEAVNQKLLKRDIVDECIKYIKTNYWDPELSLSAVSKNLRKNPSYLSDLISKKTGRTFSDLITEERLQASRKLLEDPDLTIKEISLLCGFRSQQYFNRLFKRVHKTTPTNYRNYVLHDSGSNGR